MAKKSKGNDPTPPKDYDVGYAKPPAEHRFKPGQSGNPAGRPKGQPNFATVVKKAITEKVVVTVRGRRRQKTKLEVAMAQLANKATGGDLHAIRLMLSLQPVLELNDADEIQTPDLKQNRELAQKIVARMVKKVANPGEGADDE